MEAQTKTKERIDKQDVGYLLMDVCQVAAECGISKEHVYRMRHDGLMPAPVKLGVKTVRFRRSDIELWILQGCPDAETFKQNVADAIGNK